MHVYYIESVVGLSLLQGWRKQFSIGQAKIQIGMSAWVALEHASQENSCPEILAEI